MFRKFQQNKLWRDKAIDMAEAKGSKIHWMRLDDVAMAQQLKIKFMEESQEVCATANKQALIEELADVLEVINAFGAIYNFTLQDICNARDKKYQERGGFQGRKFVTVAEHPTGSYLVDYCLKEPEKYPEIID
jgi:predicted house-cleaning noncanonical NTP pyrophosphatase (MazG superfamily)